MVPRRLQAQCAGCPQGGGAPGSTADAQGRSRQGGMTVHEQAYLLTAEIFVISFAAIFAFWFADRLRRNFFGKR